MKTVLENVHEAVALALQHFYDAKAAGAVEPLPPVKEFRLDRALQYDLCTMFARVAHTLGEVTARDVVMFCECWLSANRSVFMHPSAIVGVSTPEETRRPGEILFAQVSPDLVARRVAEYVQKHGRQSALVTSFAAALRGDVKV